MTGSVHLDTSALIGALVAGSPGDARLRQWLTDGRPLAISAPAWADFLCGPLPRDAVAMVGRILAEVVPFDTAEAEVAARLFNATGRRCGSLADCMVAATAIRRGATLATADVADFARFTDHGLRLES